MENRYGFGKSIPLGFDDAIAKVTAELQKEGFGILTEIDVAATMKKKLDFDMPRYRILGACNPPLAKRAITAEPTIGLLLPCNVVVREDATGAVQVEFLDPGMMGQMTDNSDVATLGSEVREKLQRVMGAL
ncbi:MAG: DUF302 domain-containing protein [Burkholderiaceae bacterium]|nr:DUF302 domain-containing protein [Sulfuritalea sp.]MCF8175480.1 DUF302 domain-containing protein [Burkholderiaceae bacterium]